MATASLEQPNVILSTVRPLPKVSLRRKRLTFAEYMERERVAVGKHHLVEGVMEDVSGASNEHNLICANLIGLFYAMLEESDCSVLTSDQKVYIDNYTGYYPDVLVTCGEPLIAFGEALQNPLLIIEVLSESTMAKDRGEKFRRYRTLTSLQHYILIDQYQPFIEHFQRQDNGNWVLIGEYGTLEDVWQFTLGELEIILPLAKVYRRVSFSNTTEVIEETNA